MSLPVQKKSSPKRNTMMRRTARQKITTSKMMRKRTRVMKQSNRTKVGKKTLSTRSSSPTSSPEQERLEIQL